MTPEALREKLQQDYDAKKSETHACVRIFEDDSVFITDGAGNVLIHQLNPTGGPPTGGMDVVRWYNASPT